MAILRNPDLQQSIKAPEKIAAYLKQRGIFFEQWQAQHAFSDDATQDEILQAYANTLEPFMQQGGYTTADVISINADTENYPAIRAKLLSEHTHSEDEVRFFVDGQGLFWFHLDSGEVFNVLCERGDLISVPANTKHWFDAGEKNPLVKAIRIFIDMQGWVPHYTDSKIEQQYL